MKGKKKAHSTSKSSVYVYTAGYIKSGQNEREQGREEENDRTIHTENMHYILSQI